VVNTMFKSSLLNKEITVNNPSIWRPILSIQDAANAYIRAVEANYDLSGVFNIASGNYTVGEIGDLVKSTIEDQMNVKIKLNIKNIQDYRNYKVTFNKAMDILSYKPMHEIQAIVKDLVNNYEKFKDFDNIKYYNIEVFKKMKQENEKI